MKHYIHGTRKRVHVIDLKQTARSIVSATHLANQVAAKGKKVLLVGTKVQAQNVIREVAEATGSFYVNERWLGGMLTNHEVIMQRLARLDELEAIFASENRLYSKKMLSSLNRDLKKLRRDLNGVRGMTSLPDLVVIIDVMHEHNAVKEANICGIPVVGLVDTNSDPSNVDVVIPGNDDATRAIAFVLNHIRDAILDGQKSWESEHAAAAAAPAEELDSQEDASEDDEAQVEIEAATAQK